MIESRKTPRGGLTLVETLVAVGLLALFVMTFWNLWSSASRQSTHAQQTSALIGSAVLVQEAMTRDLLGSLPLECLPADQRPLGEDLLELHLPLFERYDPAEVAAAAVALLRGQREPAEPSAPQSTPAKEDPGATPAWAKLFMGVGERDGLRAGDLLGAITGEAGVDGHSVGKIEIHESHTVVEVHDAVARKVIKALNGTTIRGRAVRADFDRPRRGTPPARGPR